VGKGGLSFIASERLLPAGPFLLINVPACCQSPSPAPGKEVGSSDLPASCTFGKNVKSLSVLQGPGLGHLLFLH